MNQPFKVLGKLLNNKYRLIHHILFTGLIFLFWFLFRVNQLPTADDVTKVILYSSTYVFIAYFNIYFLFKRFLLTERIGWYIVLSLLTFMTSYITQSFIYFTTWEQFSKDLSPSLVLAADMMINAITYYMFIGIGLSVKMIKMWLRSNEKIAVLEQENLKANLSNLKSQVNPHFLFNTFNNLYVLTKTQPLLAAEMILGFSDLMRYQLNECDKEKVAVEKEINYIENFLSLEKIRKDNLDLKISYDIKTIDGIMIEPLLFVCLIENSVKHGSQQMENPFIHVQIDRNENLFSIEVANSKPEVAQLDKNSSPGTGLNNLKKRLNLSYPGMHTLELQNSKTEFRAKLQIKLT